MRRPARGILYAEVLVAVAVLALALVPALNAIHAGLRASDGSADGTQRRFRVAARVEELLAEPFSALSAAAQAAGSPSVPTSYSDPAGTERRLVFLAHYDADNADGDNDPYTGGEANLVWMRVEIEGTQGGLETLTSP